MATPPRFKNRGHPRDLPWLRHPGSRTGATRVDPQRYLTSVLAKLPLLPRATGQVAAEEIDQYLPDVWKKDAESEPAPTS